MELKEIQQEVKKLDRTYRISRLVSLAAYLSILFFSFYLVDLSYSSDVEGIFYELAVAKLHILTTAYSGSMIGVTLGNWSGSNELKLLRKIAFKNT